MGWFKQAVFSSIGKKGIMAISGAMLGLFLLIHLAGNLTIFFGPDILNAYARRLHALGPVLYILEAGLFLVFLIHIVFALIIYFENLRARPAAYAVSCFSPSKTGAGQWLSGTMPYTGLAIFVFLIVHLYNFSFADYPQTSDAVKAVLYRPGHAIFYAMAVAALVMHLSHGFWSMFQSLGLSHPRYDSFIRTGAVYLSVVLGTILFLIPTLIWLCPGLLM